MARSRRYSAVLALVAMRIGAVARVLYGVPRPPNAPHPEVPLFERHDLTCRKAAWKLLSMVAGAAVVSGLFLDTAVARTLPETPALHARAARTDALYPLLETGWGSALADHAGILGVHYMTEQEREESRIVIERGVVYTSKGEVFPDYPETDLLIYVMDAAGNFYVGNQTRSDKLHHSSFFAGKAVAAAGEIRISKGRITMINRSSGHYKPGLEAFQRVLESLQRDGVDVEPLRSGGIR